MGEPGLDGAEPAEIYRLVSEMEPERFDALMTDPESRRRVIGALIDHMSGLFRAEAAGELEASIQIKLWDRPGGGYDHFELAIEDGRCSISEQPQADPAVTLKVRPADLRALLAGETGARRLALRGRLRVIGDLRLAARLPDLFAL